jgi:hypothetical protein
MSTILDKTSYIPLDPELYKDNTELNKIKNYILRQLGWPLIRVTLTDEMLYDAIIDALQKYTEYAAIEYNMDIVVPNGNIVELPSHIRKGSVVDILFESDYFDSLAIGALTLDYDMLGGVPALTTYNNPMSNDFDITSYYMYMQKLEDIKRIFGLKKTFEIINGVVHLYPSTTSFNRVGILYKPVEDDASVTQIPWIREYATEKARYVQGTIRARLSGVSSTGANLTNDAEAMKTEAQTKIDKLEEKLLQIGVPMPFIQG